jgi:hypothetical protein
LGEHGTGGVVRRGEQVDLPAVVAFGAPQRLAVDRDRPPSMLLARSPGAVTVGQPRADHRRQRRWIHAAKGPTDGGLGGHHPAVGGVTASAERRTHRLGSIGGPRGDRGHRPGTGQDRGGGHRQDRDQGVAAATGPPGVMDRGEVGEQVRWLGRSEGVGGGELGQGGGDRG